ncbi:molybdate transport system substrate-binding protein [Antarctobacter heliothermus]|uniref:Molybdate transport system substrate-binding protein n=2 Tax=Antarctobacter heliothermus TaxID=74033 RepID=A0A239BVG9_9RHOB|nr:molybdate transport system substrate-binding protein [Antarctobacter heliothermus]
MMWISRFFLGGAVFLALLARPVVAEPVTVFAAASLKTALDDVAAGYDGEVTLSYAGSSMLARQVQQGAPADVVFLANTDWMDVLEADGLIASGTRVDLLGNRLVLAGPAGAAPVEIGPQLDLGAMLGDGRLAMALVQAVPAGIYGKAALESLGLWAAVEHRVAQVDNVRAALALVSLGQVPLGVVYATDALADPHVDALGVFPQSSHPPIRYPVAAVAGREDAGAAFLAFLTGPEARTIFAAHGFAVLGD